MLKPRFAFLWLVVSLAAMPMARAQEAAEAVADPPEAASTASEEEPAAEPSLLDDAPQTDPENPGQASLDEAMELKLGAKDMKDLNRVIDLLDEAISEGLDADNNDFAEELLVAALKQRAGSLSGLILGQPIPDPRVDPRWVQIRTFALTDLMRIVSLDDAQLDAWFQIGRLQSLPKGNPSEARRALTKAIRLAEAAAEDPQADAPEPGTIAQAYALRGAAQPAPAKQMADFTKAIELTPDKAEYLLLRAQANRNAGNAEETLADIDRAVELAPQNAKVHELKALALLMQEKKDEALESFDKATELAPKMLTPYYYRGELYSRLGELDEAIAQLDTAVELSPNNLKSLLIRAQLLILKDEPSAYEKALGDIEGVLKQQPGLLSAHLLKAQMLDKLGRTDDAVAGLQKLVEQNPGKVELQMQLAVFFVEKQMAPEAIEVLSEVLEADSANALARRLRGDMYLFKGEHQEAIADFDEVLALNPQESGVLNNYAWTLATSPYDSVRDGQKAIELATKACEATEYNAPHILSTLAASYAEAGDFEEAVRRAEAAVAKAKELNAEEQYDGQLDAELAAYKQEQPWRELQLLEISGPAEAVADKLVSLNEPAAEGEAEGEKPQAPAPVDETPIRSIDF